jgi:hypothetical protein
MKKLPFILLVFLVSTAFAQKILKTKRASGFSIHIIGDDFEGVIFKKEYEPYPSDTPKTTSFTPTIDDIELAEKFLHQNLDTLKDGDGQSVIIHTTLRKYIRQYFGFINTKGEKIIFVNAFYDVRIYRNKKEWQKGSVNVWDGGNRFWQIKINLDKFQFFDFYVHGQG